MRTDYCGDLRPSDVGREVALCGWVARRREHGEHLAFIDLRDRSGLVQCVVDGAADLRAEYVVRVVGTVALRPPGSENANLETGGIEVQECEVEVLSAAEPTPFPLDDRADVDENVRLRYRYLDLRRERLQRNLRLRARVNTAIRASMESQGFIEIETPLLVASTPEGARDFVVPSRLNPGAFYALPQSPQLFKQLSMVGGMDRYYQLARCLRDEDLRADRQFEFTQLDMEASFVDATDVRAFVTEAVSAAIEAATGSRPTFQPDMTWHDAQERFGSDKPDTRFGLELAELTPLFASTAFNAFKAACVKGICVPGGGGRSRRELDELTEQAKRWGAKGLVWMRLDDAGELQSPVAKFLGEDELRGIVAATGATPGDLVLIVADERSAVRHVLGLLRLHLGRPPVNEGGRELLWVVDFPLFEGVDPGTGGPIPAHHPFTMPHPEDQAALGALGDPVPAPEVLLATRSQAYDLVLNGWELGSGSVRIHRGDIQQRIFELLGIDAETRQRKFGFLLDAFRFGAPPHAGFAFGVDRLVALLAGEENIREVIAFPKTQSGADPLTTAPNEIDAGHLRELGLQLLPRPS
ncbi:MAG: aspartate--tRNA ligase [Acidimicrobiia bacterium]|nr:aspartate--tRNA ligase [Acidimicrobiia bacterium]